MYSRCSNATYGFAMPVIYVIIMLPDLQVFEQWNCNVNAIVKIKLCKFPYSDGLDVTTNMRLELKKISMKPLTIPKAIL